MTLSDQQVKEREQRGLSVEPASLPISTTADLWPVVVQGMGDAMRPGDKPSPDGRARFSSGGLLKIANRQTGDVRTDKSASVHVILPPETMRLEDGTKYAAVGQVWVQPYEANSRVALSITVERLVPIK